MKILYLHGLESKPNCEKVEWLQSQGHEVTSPKINYKDKNVDLNQYTKTKFDLIIGSSMGGYAAYMLGKQTGTDLLLLNPALHSRTFDPNFRLSSKDSLLCPNVYLAVGEQDKIIEPLRTVDILLHDTEVNFDMDNYILGEHGHRTTVDFFKDAFIDATGNPPPFDSQGNPIEDDFMDIEHTWHNEQEI